MTQQQTHGSPHDNVTLAARTVLVRDVMVPGVVCVRMDTPVAAVTAVIVEHHLRSVPVVDEDRGLVGIITKTDLLRAHDWRGSSMSATHVMTPIVHSLPEDAPLSYAIALMANDSLLEVPIVSREGQITGIVTALDVMRWIARELGYVTPRS